MTKKKGKKTVIVNDSCRTSFPKFIWVVLSLLHFKALFSSAFFIIHHWYQIVKMSRAPESTVGGGGVIFPLSYWTCKFMNQSTFVVWSGSLNSSLNSKLHQKILFGRWIFCSTDVLTGLTSPKQWKYRKNTQWDGSNEPWAIYSEREKF